MASDVLTDRELSRATLERQLLLRRSALGVLEVVEHLVGMQAQIPLNPYGGLWSRVDGFEPGRLSALLIDRRVVRIVALRGTLHLLSADDCLVLRPLAQQVLDLELQRHRDYAPVLRGLDLEPVLAFARAYLEVQPRTGAQLRTVLAERFPGLDAAALAYACRNHLALVQVPPRGVWGRSAQIALTTAESWLGRPLCANPSLDDVVLRYFGAFGPATAADVATWTRLAAMHEVVERLRPKLRVFRGERGRELFDLPDAPRPDPDTPAPPRFLPEYDNVLLSHADRSRFVSEQERKRLFHAAVTVRGSVLHDGRLAGVWSIERGGSDDEPKLVVSHLRHVTKRAQAAIAAEGRRFLRFSEPHPLRYDVRFSSVEH